MGVIYTPTNDPIGNVALWAGDGSALLVTAAGSDARANSQVGLLSDSRGMGWNGTTWDRLKSKGTGYQAVTLVRSSDGVDALALTTTGDGVGLQISAAVFAENRLYNGATQDKQRGNVAAAALVSAARTITTPTPDITTYNARSLSIVLDVSLIGTGSITVSIQGKDSTSGNYVTLLTGAAVVGNGTTIYQVGPSLVAVANLVANAAMWRTMRALVTANNANPVTYSVSSELGV